MKKFLFILFICVIVFCCFFIADCVCLGAYKLEKIKINNGIEYTEMVVGEEIEGSLITKDLITLILKKDGKGEFGVKDLKSEITWSKKDDVIEIDFDGELIDFYKNGKTLTATIDGSTIFLKKQTLFETIKDLLNI